MAAIVLIVIALLAACFSGDKRCRHAILSSKQPFRFFFAVLDRASLEERVCRWSKALAVLESHAMDNWTNLEQESVLTVQIPYYPHRPWKLTVVLTGHVAAVLDILCVHRCSAAFVH